VLLDALAASDRLSNTLIVFTSDNGFLLGEHRLRGKPFPWEASHRVPFLIRYDPSVTSGITSTALVLTTDIAPTILDVAGVAAPPMDGRSLVPILSRDRVRVRSRILIENAYSGGPAPPYCGTRSRYSLFIRHATGEEEFYDYRQDPWELRNRATDPDLRTRITLARRFTREHCAPTPPGFSW
jgi:N-acetylglucosamine-6-sulfatase